MRKNYRTRQELCDAIYTAVRDAGRPVSRNEIARAIGTTKYPGLINMAEELASTGWLKKEMGSDPWGRATWLYSIGIVVSSTVEACGEVAV